VLGAISENRNDELEASVRDKWIHELEDEKKPACLKERVTFLSQQEITLQIRLDYAEWSTAHKHILRTPMRVPAYGATLVPYRWLLRESAYELAKEFNLDVSPEREPTNPAFLTRTDWIQNDENQRALLDGFAARCIDHESLVFFYAKRTPLADDDRRVIVAVGMLAHKGNVAQYQYDRNAPKDHLRAMMWERPFQHSIRPDRTNLGHFTGGIVLPYHAALKRADEDESLDTAELLACAPEEARQQFSYASEHVTHGVAITSLLACKSALERASKHLTGPWPQQIDWIDQQINRLWKLNGPCPGLGSAMSALEDGFNGSLFALALSDTLAETDDPWQVADKIFRKEVPAPAGAPKITNMLRRRWEFLHKEEPKRAALLRLLSRFELTRDQAIRWFNSKELTDSILDNPYLLYERDRFENDSIGLWTIDRGLFPAEEITKRYPLPKECTIDPEETDDPRRLRAAAVMILEKAAAEAGHTLLGVEMLHAAAKELPASHPIPLDGTAVKLCKQDFAAEIATAEAPGVGGLATQLQRYATYGRLIRDAVSERIKAKIPETTIDWRAKLDRAFGPIADDDKEEEKARREKSFALQVMANSRLSVLIGPAGTGKTTVLRHLLEERKLVGSGVALLAPTGKARVRLGQQTRMPDKAKTLALFLKEYSRYDSSTSRYFADRQAPQADGITTCVVDEASMLTEDQLAALLDALPVSTRLVFVGDPRQLPPIGAGRPFVDLISHLERKHEAKGLAELTVRRRHASGKAIGKSLRDLACADVQLADLFSGRTLPPGEDEILETVLSGKHDGRLRFINWKTPSDLRTTLDNVIKEELKITSDDAEAGFGESIGGDEQGGYVYFNPGPHIAKCENWQVLTPHRTQTSGSIDLNRHIKERFRNNTLSFARGSNQGPPFYLRYRMIAPRGPEQITYGDKVICIRNHERSNWRYPKAKGEKGEKDEGYIANGEIGVVIGEAYKAKQRPDWTKVQFASQPDVVYSFGSWDFKEEGSPILELAYAITAHKAQGSEFGMVLLVLPARSRLLSRELLYTALTRQMNRVVILHQGELEHLRAYRSSFFSEVARRVTNLFAEPKMVEAASPTVTAGPIGRNFLESNLIHRTARGDLVNSKSEVIIADALFAAEKDYGIRYFYERQLIGTNGRRRWPDFSIEDRNGEVWFWEHCGMLDQPDYERRWNAKLAFYKENKIQPWSPETPNGRLIVTEDGGKKGLDSLAIREMIRSIFE
jgi:hypothetical protein